MWRSRCNSSPHHLNLCKVTFRSVRERNKNHENQTTLCQVCVWGEQTQMLWVSREEKRRDVTSEETQNKKTCVGDKEGNQSQSITCCRSAGAERKNCRMDDKATQEGKVNNTFISRFKWVTGSWSCTWPEENALFQSSPHLSTVLLTKNELKSHTRS